jgi:uncharacterized membrane protein
MACFLYNNDLKINMKNENENKNEKKKKKKLKNNDSKVYNKSGTSH